MRICPGEHHRYVELLQGRVEMHTVDGREAPCLVGYSKNHASLVLRCWEANPQVYPDGHAPAIQMVPPKARRTMSGKGEMGGVGSRNALGKPRGSSQAVLGEVPE